MAHHDEAQGNQGPRHHADAQTNHDNGSSRLVHPLAGQIAAQFQHNAQDKDAESDAQLLDQHHPGCVEAGGVIRVGINGVRQQRPGDEEGCGAPQAQKDDGEHQQGQKQPLPSTTHLCGEGGQHQGQNKGNTPEGQPPSQGQNPPPPLGHLPPKPEPHHGRDLKHHGHCQGPVVPQVQHHPQEQQGDSLHQLKGIPEQQIEPQNHAEAPIGGNPSQLHPDGFQMGGWPEGIPGKRAESKGTDQSGPCNQGAPQNSQPLIPHRTLTHQ